jgi:hypothetical protein
MILIDSQDTLSHDSLSEDQSSKVGNKLKFKGSNDKKYKWFDSSSLRYYIWHL